jgi:poly-gamma-glutamate synthesis protein (capsule biosynthesis protein)
VIPLHLLAVGDAIPHEALLANAAIHGWPAVYAEIAPVIAGGDLAILNLESPSAPGVPAATGPIAFDAPPEMLIALRDAGFDAVSQANNHAWDQGAEGIVETMGQLDVAGLAHVGTGATCGDAAHPKMLLLGDVSIGWISATRVHNYPWMNGRADRPCANELTSAGVAAGVAEARAQGAELVVLSAHWGEEYQTSPTAGDEAFARSFIASGVDVILGHHPHVLQRVDWVESEGRRGLVAWSLGNFATAQGLGTHPGETAALRRDGVVLDITVERVNGVGTVTGATAIPTTIERACGGVGLRVVRLDHPGAPSCAAEYALRYASAREALGEWLFPSR